MEADKDDEISFDLSKIKGFFKRKKEGQELGKAKKETGEAKAEPKIEEKSAQKDDEIAIDLSKIKNIFKSKEPENKSAGDVKEKGNDEISIDAQKSKISGTPEISKKFPSVPENSDEEFSLDFSRLKNIKNIFKKSENEGPEEDLSADFKKVSDFFVKYRVLLLLIIPIFLSLFLRVQPAYLPATDEWAANSVISNLRSQISSQISQQYPNLPAQNLNPLVEKELQKVLQQQKSQINDQIRAVSDFFKSKMQDDSGLTYLPTIDPYYWLRFSENIVKNGHPGDEIKDGEPWDNHMFAPVGRGVPPDMFHAYFTVYLFKFLKLFNRELSLAAVAFYIPALISALAVIPAFFITRKITGNFGGFIAATIVAIHPSFLIRTMGGIFDTDGYNVVFPLLITWIFIEALESRNIKNNVILSAVGGLLVGLFSFTWGGWWYIFDFVLASTALYIAYYSFVHKKEIMQSFANFLKQKAIKNSIIFLATFFIVAALSVSLFVSFAHFTKFAKGPTGFARLKEVGITKIWPNVFTTVAEQNPASLEDVVNQIGLGNELFFLIALMGIAITIIITKKERRNLWFVLGTLAWYILIFLFKVQSLNTFLILISIPIIIGIAMALWKSDTEIDIKYAILLIIWFIATTFASTKGVRFNLLLVPAFAIGFGIALGELYKHANSWITKGLQVNKYISKTSVAIVLLLLLIPPYISAKGTAKNMVSDFDDAWRASLEKIRADSKPDAIVNSWWDYGHWFKYWTDRAVTFDGTSQNTPPAHWIGKVLLTSDEKLAVGILRMLDCGSRMGFEEVAALTKDGTEAIDLMYKIMPLNREDAKKVLSEKFGKDDVEKVLDLTHCQPPENYFITSEDMVGKSGVWAHFGSWDFNRALIYNTLKKKEYSSNLDKSVEFLQKRFNYSKDKAESLFNEVQDITTSDKANTWIAPWPGYAGAVGCSKDKDKEYILICDNDFTIDLKSREASAQSSQGTVHPREISFPTNNNVVIKKYNESVVTLQNGRYLGFALVGEGSDYRLLQMDADMTGSMFTRMFYQDGVGLRYFKKFSDENTIFGSRVIVWKVDWEGKEKNIIEAPQPETEEEAKTPETKEGNATASNNS